MVNLCCAHITHTDCSNRQIILFLDQKCCMCRYVHSNRKKVIKLFVVCILHESVKNNQNEKQK